MKEVKIKDIVVGSGIPKVCVPIVGKTEDEILNEAAYISTLDIDIVEWRVDYFTAWNDVQKVVGIAKKLRTIFRQTPLLFTLRTKPEGGNNFCSEEQYIMVNKQVIQSKLIDLIDIEFYFPKKITAELIEMANEYDVKVILSHHDFGKTPPQQEIIRQLQQMQEQEADICKIAVMPQTNEDVLTLLQATNEMNTRYATQPIVTISMGTLGCVSRICGELIGSAITFSSSIGTSALGQLPVSELRPILELLHDKK